MRNAKTLLILAAITVMVVVAAIVSRQESTAIPRQGESLFPKLMADINDTVEVVGASKGNTFTLTRRDGRWVVKERSDYPADADRVQELLVGTAQLRRVEPKTRKPDLYAKLGVEDIDHEKSTSVKIALKNAAGATLAELIVGQSRWSKGDPSQREYYVRLPQDPQAWLVEGQIPEEKSPSKWLDDEVLGLDSARVREVSVTHADGHTVVVRRSDPKEDDFELVGLPKGAEVESVYKINSIGNTLTNLTLDDVKPAAAVSFEKRSGLSVVLKTFDGLAVTMQTTKDDDRTLARFSAAFDPPLMHKKVSDKPQAKTEASSSNNEGKLKTADAVKQEIKKLNNRWEGWAYIVPKYRVDDLAKRKSELIKVSKKSKKTKGG
ncbi:MAG: DUF4340 domain-containing protein [Acidiferrobacterales bacterium]